MKWFTDAGSKKLVKDSGRHTSVSVVIYHGNIVAWRSRKQTVVTDEICCAELYAINNGLKLGIQIRNLLLELGIISLRESKTDLNDALMRSMVASLDKTIKGKSDSVKSLEQTLRDEITGFEATGHRGKLLEKIYEYLLLIKPSILINEQTFSIASYFCSKVRSRLGDESLFDLVYLKYYFKRNRPF